MTIEVEGLDQLTQDLHGLADWLREPTPLNLAVAQLVVREAQPRTPRRTGRLAASMDAQATPDAARLVARTPYAAPVHWGVPSHNQKAQPWLLDTATATQGQWTAAALDTIDEQLRDVNGK